MCSGLPDSFLRMPLSTIKSHMRLGLTGFFKGLLVVTYEFLPESPFEYRTRRLQAFLHSSDSCVLLVVTVLHLTLGYEIIRILRA